MSRARDLADTFAVGGPLGHSWGAWKRTAEPACTAAGGNGDALAATGDPAFIAVPAAFAGAAIAYMGLRRRAS